MTYIIVVAEAVMKISNDPVDVKNKPPVFLMISLALL